jgi:hypothetical protein
MADAKLGTASKAPCEKNEKDRRGHRGTVGPTGPSGLTGDPGTPGDPGASGPTGPEGIPGDPGAAGNTGPTGATGALGVPGDPGLTGTTGPGGAGLAPVNATARVTENGAFTAQHGFSAITHPSTGEYQLTLSSPPADINNLSIVATLGPTPTPTALSFPVAFSLNVPNQIVIFIKDSTNTAADAPFSVTAYDLS